MKLIQMMPLLGVMCLTVVACQSPDHSAPPSKEALLEALLADDAGVSLDQSGAVDDLQLTQAVKQALDKDEGLVAEAKNVKIVTSGGVVTLSGQVKSAGEKQAVEQIAKQTTGVKSVDNQLQVMNSSTK